MPGSLYLGEGLFGESFEGATASPVKTPPKAILFDARTRLHTFNADGSNVEIHPVDAAVINCLHHKRGELKSCMDTGARFHRLRSAYDKRAQATVQDMAREALSRLLARGDISIDSIQLQASASGAMILVSYFNERLYPRAPSPNTVEFALS